MRAIVCDDDPVLRRVVASMVEELGGEVIAESDNAIEAVALIDRLDPDTAVIDLSLQWGSGWDILEHVNQRGGCHAIVFTAFAEEFDPLHHAGAEAVVLKPDFDQLRVALAAKPTVTALADRRVFASRMVAPRPTREDDDVSDFYTTLQEAQPGDALMSLEPVAIGPDDAATDRLREIVEQTVRAQDRILRRSDQLLVLLIGGDPAAAASVGNRVLSAWQAEGGGDLITSRVIFGEDQRPADVFMDFTARPLA